MRKSRPNPPPPFEEKIKVERLVLRALCTGTPEGSVRETARRLLRDYSWREPVHRVLFEVLNALPSDRPEDIRSLLPSRLTLRGFPDLDCDDLFLPHSLSGKDAMRLMQKLCAS
ncbi:MAG: hypothetical protein HYS33_09310 [Acidobacteria bacterium]|nr:hypothetical protein [Acidobacteriota bacterium]